MQGFSKRKFITTSETENNIFAYIETVSRQAVYLYEHRLSWFQSFPGGRSSIQELTTRSTVRSLKHKLNANHILGVILNDLISLKAFKLSIFREQKIWVMLHILKCAAKDLQLIP